ncbi:MAG: peptidoglycan-binding protein, partial [Nostoc sp.]
LKVDGITGLATKVSLQAAMVSKNQIITSPIVTSPAATSNPIAKPNLTAKPKPTERGFVWWLIFAIGVIGSIGALVYLLRWFRQVKQVQNSEISNIKSLSETQKHPILPPSPETATILETATPPFATQLLLPEKTSRLAKLN